MSRKPKHADGIFIKTWNTSGSVKEAAEKLGMTRAGVLARARFLIKRDVSLKTSFIRKYTRKEAVAA